MAIRRDGELVPILDPESLEQNVILKEGMTVGLAGGDYGTKANVLNNTGILYKDKTGKGGGTEVFYSDINGTRYYWDAQGTCLNIQNPNYNAVVINNSFSNDSDENASVIDSDGDDTGNTASVKTLNARDSFALSALAALIDKHPEPINTEASTINLLAKRAYEYATAMMFTSAQLRAQDEESSQSDAHVDIDTNSLNNVSDKLLNNIAVALEGINSAGVKVKNPLNTTNNTKDPLAIEGGGGSGGGTSEVEVTFNIDELKDALVNNLDYTTLNNIAALGYILGFYKNSSDKYIPTVNSLLELRQNIELNIKSNSNALLHWLTVYGPYNVVIESISDFLTAYKSDFISALKASWRAEIKAIILEVLNSLEYNASLNVSVTRNNINAKDVDTDSDWQ